MTQLADCDGQIEQVLEERGLEEDKNENDENHDEKKPSNEQKTSLSRKPSSQSLRSQHSMVSHDSHGARRHTVLRGQSTREIFMDLEKQLAELDVHANAALDEFFSLEVLTTELGKIDSQTVSWVRYKEKKKKFTMYMSMVEDKLKAQDKLRALQDKHKRRDDEIRNNIDPDAITNVEESGVNLADDRCVDIPAALKAFDNNKPFMALMMANVYKAYCQRWEKDLAKAIHELDMDLLVDVCLCIKVGEGFNNSTPSHLVLQAHISVFPYFFNT